MSESTSEPWLPTVPPEDEREPMIDPPEDDGQGGQEPYDQSDERVSGGAEA